jgi:hypothetical protein
MVNCFQALLSNPTCAATQRRAQAQRGGEGRDGGAVQVDPIKPTLKAPGSKRLKLEHEKSTSPQKTNRRRNSTRGSSSSAPPRASNTSTSTSPRRTRSEKITAAAGGHRGRTRRGRPTPPPPPSPLLRADPSVACWSTTQLARPMQIQRLVTAAIGKLPPFK